ncbi:restriction endonuclease subunit S [Mycoplasma anserisalpingitidis]|uniref:restriction endonuclease subunit S n=1 Tax=Mycoplasma anserisalpingitidis TaxID=519450 RepID=UPI001CF663B7|nr:restriction endonuclease subunit S [Mycoplasma anserisalpingitidis]UCU27008.1 restriction endonuclease subunit S [Mycoplasma anserisalpingitidis]UCU27135.1 restriction endonuclease subunit S [Mycoplasma anserisalpingitidis]
MSKIWDLIKNEKVEWKTVDEVCDIKRGTKITKKIIEENKGEYPVYSSQTTNNGEIGKLNYYMFDGEYVTWTTDGCYAGTFYYRNEKFSATTHCGVLSVKCGQKLLTKFLYYYLTYDSLNLKNSIVGTIPLFTSEMVSWIKIPIPSIDTQNKIVKILDKFNIYVKELERELELRNKQYQHYRDYILNKYLFKLCKKNGTNIEKRKLCELLEYEQPGKYIVKKSKYSNKFNTPVLTPGKTFILGYTNEIEGIYKANKNNPVILFDDFTAAFKWVDFEFKIKSSATKIISPKININLKYCFYNMQMLNFVNEEHKRIWISEYSQIKINIPNITIQNKVVEILDNFFNSTNKIDEGLPKEIKLRKQQYEYYRNKLLDFSKN